ncbi:MAG: PAAR domain-containing protein [Agromyces sp.]
MPAAVRLADPTVHGGLITGPGIAAVLIGGMPAAVAGDLSACPLTSAGHPPTSPMAPGSPTVLIGSRPALRVDDLSACGATAAVGYPTVVIA